MKLRQKFDYTVIFSKSAKITVYYLFIIVRLDHVKTLVSFHMRSRFLFSFVLIMWKPVSFHMRSRFLFSFVLIMWKPLQGFHMRSRFLLTFVFTMW